MQEALVVRREAHIPAPPAAVFALLTDPEKILRWMGTEAQVEPQPGGLLATSHSHSPLGSDSSSRLSALARLPHAKVEHRSLAYRSCGVNFSTIKR